MQMFMDNRVAPDEPRKAVIYQNFQQNLTDILRAGLKSGARIILCNVASNLRIVRHSLPCRRKLSRKAIASLATSCGPRRAAESQGKLVEAARSYHEAASSTQGRRILSFLRRIACCVSPIVPKLYLISRKPAIWMRSPSGLTHDSIA